MSGANTFLCASFCSGYFNPQAKANSSTCTYTTSSSPLPPQILKLSSSSFLARLPNLECQEHMLCFWSCSSPKYIFLGFAKSWILVLSFFFCLLIVFEASSYLVAFLIDLLHIYDYCIPVINLRMYFKGSLKLTQFLMIHWKKNPGWIRWSFAWEELRMILR